MEYTVDSGDGCGGISGDNGNEDDPLRDENGEEAFVYDWMSVIPKLKPGLFTIDIEKAIKVVEQPGRSSRLRARRRMSRDMQQKSDEDIKVEDNEKFFKSTQDENAFEGKIELIRQVASVFDACPGCCLSKRKSRTRGRGVILSIFGLFALAYPWLLFMQVGSLRTLGIFFSSAGILLSGLGVIYHCIPLLEDGLRANVWASAIERQAPLEIAKGASAIMPVAGTIAFFFC